MSFLVFLFFFILFWPSHRCSFLSLLFLVFPLFCTLRRSIFRCVDLIILSCSFDILHVPLAYVSVGVITTLNTRILQHRRYDLDVNSCLSAHAALILFLTSAVSCSSNVIACPRNFALPFFLQHFDLDIVNWDLFFVLSHLDC